MLNAWMEVVSPPSPSASQLFLYWEYIIKRKTRDIRKITPSPRAYFDRLLHLLGTTTVDCAQPKPTQLEANFPG